MEKKNEPAFPVTPSSVALSRETVSGGLTKREYAAIAIMAGYAASPLNSLSNVNQSIRAGWAVQEADALLEELAK